VKKCLLPVVFLANVLAQDQSPNARPKFAVASIKLDNSPAAWRIGLETHPGGRIHFSGPLVFLLGFAYDVPFNSKRMTGVPDWGYKEAYVIDAAPDPRVIPAGLATTALRERVRPMLQALLADRFHLVMRRDTQELPVYALTLVGRPKLRLAGIEEKDVPWMAGSTVTACAAALRASQDGPSVWTIWRSSSPTGRTGRSSIAPA
jgi:uncharacterized protein (TIGR03435 family)